MTTLTGTTVLNTIRRMETGYYHEAGKLRHANEYDREKFRAAREAIKGVLEASSSGSDRSLLAAAVVAGILGTHRYQQQQGIAAILEGFGLFASLTEQPDNEWLIDARNRAIVDACKTLREAMAPWIYFAEDVKSKAPEEEELMRGLMMAEVLDKVVAELEFVLSDRCGPCERQEKLTALLAEVRETRDALRNRGGVVPGK